MNRHKFIDLFCGCGGLSLGFEMAGFTAVAGVDFKESAINTYRENFPNAKAICADISSIDREHIRDIFGDLSEIDVIIGGPPCQGFSNANKNYVELDDPRNKLFFEFVKFVELIQPKVVLIENVPQIITKDNGYAKRRIEEIFTGMNYFVTNEVLDASQYGVPQKRLRNFFVITKECEFDMGSILREKVIPTVKEAIGDLYVFEDITSDKKIVESMPQTEFQKYLRNNADKELLNHDIHYPAKIQQERISYVPQGGNWRDVPEKLWVTKRTTQTGRTNRHSSAYKRLKENDVSVTIDAGNQHSNYYHPIFNRIPTVREAARIQSFPDHFVFRGTMTEQYLQVGNAVPPLLAKHIAEAIRKRLDNEK